MKISVAVADRGRNGDVRFYGDISSDAGFPAASRSYLQRPLAWTQIHRRWMAELSFTHPAHYIVLADYIQAIEDAEGRVERLTKQIAATLGSLSMAPVVEAYQAMRGVALLTAVTFVVEIGDVRRFETAP